MKVPGFLRLGAIARRDRRLDPVLSENAQLAEPRSPRGEEPSSEEKQRRLKLAIKDLRRLDSVQALKAVLHAMFLLDDVVTEKTYDALAEILAQEHNIYRMLLLLTADGSDSSDSANLLLDYEADARAMYQYRYVVCLYLCYGPTIIRDRMLQAQKLLRPLVQYISAKGVRSVVVMELVSRVLASLLHHNSKLLLSFALAHRNVLSAVVAHVGCSALSALLPRMLCERGFFDDEELRFGKINLVALHVMSRDDVQMLIARQIVTVVSTGVVVLTTALTVENGLVAMRNISLRAMMAIANEGDSVDVNSGPDGYPGRRPASVDNALPPRADSNEQQLVQALRSSTMFSSNLSLTSSVDPLVHTTRHSITKLNLMLNAAPIALLFELAREPHGAWILPELVLNINRLLHSFSRGFFSRKDFIVRTVRATNIAPLRSVLLDNSDVMISAVRAVDSAEQPQRVSRLYLTMLELLARLTVIADSSATAQLASLGVPELLLDALVLHIRCDMTASLLLSQIKLSLILNARNAAALWFIDARISDRFRQQMDVLRASGKLESGVDCAEVSVLLELGKILGRFLEMEQHRVVVEQQVASKLRNFDAIRSFFAGFVDVDDPDPLEEANARRMTSFSDAVVFDEDEGEALWIYNMLIDKDAWGDLSDGKVNAKRSAGETG